MQQRMDAHVGTWRKIHIVLVPEFRRLVAEVPGAVEAARTEDPFLGARRLFVTADAGDDAFKTIALQRLLEAEALARG